MRRIRIKKDISVVWRITTNGQSTSLAGRDLSLVLLDPKHKKTSLSFTIEGNALHFRVGHQLQSFIGVYALELWENLGENNQTVVDRTSAFELVSRTNQEDNGTEDDIAAATADLGTASLAVGVKGDKGDKGDQGDPGSDANVTEENIILALGYTPADNAELGDLQTELAGKVTNGNNESVSINVESGHTGVSLESGHISMSVDHGPYLSLDRTEGAKLNDKPIATTDQIPNVSGKADKTYVDTELAKCIKGNESGEYILPNDTNFIGADPNGYEETTEYASFGENGVAIVSGDHDVRILAESGSIEMVSQNGATINDKQIATTDQIPDISGKVDKVTGKGLINSAVASSLQMYNNGEAIGTDKNLFVDGKIHAEDSIYSAEGIYVGADCGIYDLSGNYLKNKADKADLGTLSSLTTTDKSSAVAAINEISTELTDFLKVDSVKDNGNIVLTDKSGNKKEYMAATPSGDPMHYAYVDGGAVWNASTGYWELNGLTDITNRQMQAIYRCYCKPLQEAAYIYDDQSDLLEPRTNLHYPGYLRTISISIASLARQQKIEVFSFYKVGSPKMVIANSCCAAFMDCPSLKRIETIIDIGYATNLTNFLVNTPLLEYVKLYRIKVSLNIAKSKNLLNECVAYIINNAANTSAITITLHADAYARAIADADIVAAAASHNITLASA